MEDHVLQAIRAEHDLIRKLTELLLATSGNDGYRAQLWFRLKTELVTHARAEEAALYDRLMAIDTTAELARHSVKEHDAIDELIEQLDHIGFDQPDWKTTLARLAHVSEHHLAEEEAELFPVAGRVLSDEQKDAFTSDYRAEKMRLIRRHHEELERTTSMGVDGRTLESRATTDLIDLARQRGVPSVSDLSRSQIISQLRGAPAADA